MWITDLFELFGVTRVTRETGVPNANNIGALEDIDNDTHPHASAGNGSNKAASTVSAAVALPGAGTPGAADVTRPPSHGNSRVTGQSAKKSNLTKDIPGPLPPSPLLPTGTALASDVAAAQGLLADPFARIASWWVEGATLPPTALEVEIGRAVLAGDIDATRAALSVYEQAARESCAAATNRAFPGGRVLQ